jgi:cyclopropane fatty-acyl-phospholipid synthase-like methyltransferase
MTTNFDAIARPYRWLEYLSFGPMLERCRFHRLHELTDARRALVLGDGDGRFLARLASQNPQIQADVVDLSPAMLRLLSGRVAKIGGQDRITLHCADAREFAPSGDYDLVVTHFFLDCFTTAEVLNLTARIRSYLCPGARWVVSEFAIPRGPLSSILARLLVRSLYAAFRLLTGLKTHRLPDYAAALRSCGLALVSRHHWFQGLMVSEIWEVQATTSPQGPFHL